MNLLKLFLCILISFSQISFAQSINDNLAWGWTRVEGTIDSPHLPESLNSKLLGSVEFHYRLNNNASEFQNLILRPMFGYKLNDSRTMWVGYAYVENQVDDSIVREQRMFQMLSYGHKFSNDSIVFVGNTRLEERFFEDSDEVAFRLRQMLRVSFDLFKIRENQISLFIQNEYFYGLNQTDVVSTPGFNQNRFLIGLGVNSTIGNTPVNFNIGYMNNLQRGGQLDHGVNFGIAITIPSRAKGK